MDNTIKEFNGYKYREVQVYSNRPEFRSEYDAPIWYVINNKYLHQYEDEDGLKRHLKLTNALKSTTTILGRKKDEGIHIICNKLAKVYYENI